MATAHVVVLVSALLGWSDITIQPSRGDRGFSSFQHSVAGIDRPSERTLETLKRYDLERPYRRNVNNALLSLEKVAASIRTQSLSMRLPSSPGSTA